MTAEDHPADPAAGGAPEQHDGAPEQHAAAPEQRGGAPGRDGGGAQEPYAGAPNPEATVPKLDAGQLEVLREVGHEWDRTCGDPAVWHAGAPGRSRPRQLSRPQRDPPEPLRALRAGRRAARPAADDRGQHRGGDAELRGRALRPPARRIVIGPPLSATAIARERMRKLVALPVLSADALSSVAYGPEAMLAVLVLAGTRRAELLAADRRRRSLS